MKLIAVGNTGPLLSAFQCGRVDVLEGLLERILIPPAVRSELERHGVLPLAEPLIRLGFLQEVPLSASELRRALVIAKRVGTLSPRRNRRAGLHLGEAQAMVLAARENRANRMVLIDERAAWSVAIELGLQPVGFPGLLLRAVQSAIITSEAALRAIQACRAVGTWYDDRIESLFRRPPA